MEPDVEPVVVVGAGPTGLVAAILLAQYGIRVVLLERHRQAYSLPRAVHVDDQVLRILQQVGIAEEFAAISRPAAGMRLLDADHRVIAEFRRDKQDGVHGYPQANLFDQPDLERLLREALGGYSKIEFRTGFEVTGLAFDGPSVLVKYRDDAKVDGEIRARAVLGCDGAGSTVRDLIGSTLEDLGFEERWLVVDLRSSSGLRVWDGVEQICDPRRAATCMRVGPDRYRWEFRLHPGETAAQLGTPERLRTLLIPWLTSAASTPSAPTGDIPAGDIPTGNISAGDIPNAEFDVLRAAEYTFKARLADQWRLGTVFLLGDAAHLTPPFIGQGLGAGLRDAHNLAWKLATALSDASSGFEQPGFERSGFERSGRHLLDTYQSERKPHARSLIELAVLAGWAMTGGQDRAATVRRAALALACRVPGITTRILDDTSPRLRPGPLVQSSSLLRRLFRPGRDPAGALCPQPWVVTAGRRLRLDDVLGPWFAVLALDPPDAEVRALAARFGARLIAVHARPGTDVLVGDGEALRIEAPELSRWLARSRSRAALIRPDRVVQLSLPPMSVHRPGRYGGRADPYPRQERRELS